MKRFKKDFRCPVCGGYDGAKRGSGVRCFGYLSDDGEWCHCTRQEFAGDAPYNEKSETYVHKMSGDCKCGISHDGSAPAPKSGSPLKQKDKPEKKAPAEKEPPAERSVMERCYPYQNEKGETIFEVVRMKPKGFSQRRPNPDKAGAWIWNMKGIRRVIYNLPGLKANQDDLVYLCEGEKDADRLIDENLLATTGPGGAKKWQKSFSQMLKHRNVVILPDQNDGLDKPEDHPEHRKGEKHAGEVAKSLHGVASSVRVLLLPGMEDKKGADVSDWFDAGHTAKELKELAMAMAEFIPSKPSDDGEDEKESPDSDSKYNNTDLGNSRRLVDKFQKIIRYCEPLGGWYIWNKKKWRHDDTEEIYRLAQETVKSIFREARKLKASAKAVLTKWALKSESAGLIHNMVRLARTQPEVVADGDIFDRDPWIFNCANGVIDLKTGELKPHDPKYFMTKMSPAKYDPKGFSQLWQDFLDKVLPDIDLQIFTQQSAGYTMTGLTSEKRLFFLYGDTDTGKSTFIDSIHRVMGDYSTVVDFETFLRSRDQGGPRNDIAALKGKRLVIAQEVDEGRRLAESTIKTLVSGDPVKARFLHREFFEFQPIAAIWLAANDRPRVRDDDNAMWRRMLQLPFYQQIPIKEQDQSVKRRLGNVKESGAAILKWMVDGCRWWAIDGLKVPAAVREATADYRREMDPMQDWMEDCITRHETLNANMTDTWNNYQDWAKQNGIRFSLGRKRFNSRLRQRFQEDRAGETRWWVGFALKSPDQQQSSLPYDAGEKEDANFGS